MVYNTKSKMLLHLAFYKVFLSEFFSLLNLISNLIFSVSSGLIRLSAIFIILFGKSEFFVVKQILSQKNAVVNTQKWKLMVYLQLLAEFCR